MNRLTRPAPLAALLLASLWGCPSGTTTPPFLPDSGRLPDGGPIVVIFPACTANDGLACNLDAGDGICCGGTCVDTQSDPENCDGCGQGCVQGAVCGEGTCRVGGAASVCLDGGCLSPRVCAGTSFCVQPTCGAGTPGGACALITGAEGVCCDGGCYETFAGCSGEVLPPDGGVDGGSGDGGDAGSDGGALDGGDAGLDAGFLCGALDGVQCALDAGGLGICCLTLCVDTQSTAADCDGCGIFCPPGEVCSEGTCYAGAVATTCDAGGCDAGLICVDDNYCLAPTCGAQETGAACALDTGARGLCCDGGCFEASAGCQGLVVPDGGPDAGLADAGADAGPDAGVVDAGPDAGFDAGPACGATDGVQCTIVASVTGVCCGGSCVDTQSSDANCDGCGNNYPLSATCTEGTCLIGNAVASCDAGGCATGLTCVGRYFCLSSTCGAQETGAACALGDGGLGSCLSGTCANRA